MVSKGEALLGAGVFTLGIAGIAASFGLGPTENLFGGLGLLVLAGSIALIGVAIAVDGKALDMFAATVIGGAALIIGLESIASAVRNASSGSVAAGMVGTALGIAVIGLGATGVLTRFRSGDLKIEMSPPRTDGRPPATVHQQPGTLVRPLGTPGMTRLTRERVAELRALVDDRDATISSTQEMVTKLVRQNRDHEINRKADQELIERLNDESKSLGEQLARSKAQAEAAQAEADKSGRKAARLRDMTPEVQRLGTELARAHKELTTSEAAKNRALAATKSAEANLAESAELLEQRTAELQEQADVLRSVEQRLAEQSESVSDLKAIRARVEAERDEAVAAIQGLDQTVATAAAIETQLRAEVTTLEDAVSDADIRKKFRDSEIRDLNHVRQQLLAQVEGLAAELANAEDATTTALAKLTDRERDLEKVVVRAANADADVAEQRARAAQDAEEANGLRRRVESLTRELASTAGFRSELEVLSEQFFAQQNQLSAREAEVAEFRELARRYAARTEQLEDELVESQQDIGKRIADAFDSGSALGERAALEGAEKDARIEQLETELRAATGMVIDAPATAETSADDMTTRS